MALTHHDRTLIFLLEEESMKALLDVLLPQMLPKHIKFICIPHEGKQDLEKSIPRKLKAFQTPDTSFVIVRDKDKDDCVELKNRLALLCTNAGRGDSLVRIVCHELESWFLGDLPAIEKAYDIKKLGAQQKSRKYREPDKLANASEELGKLIKGYRKISGAKRIGAHMNISQNNSDSFNCFIRGIERIVNLENV